jgi:hypothetical protein
LLVAGKFAVRAAVQRVENEIGLSVHRAVSLAAARPSAREK